MDAVIIAKNILRKAARAVRNVCQLRGAQTAGERVHWILAALRGAQFSLLDRVLEATQAYPAIAPHFSVETCSLRNPAHLQIMLEENLRMSVEDRIAEVRACSEMPEYQRAKQIEKLQSWSKNWAPTGRRTSLQGVRRPDGTATTEPDEAITLLIRLLVPRIR